MSDVNIKQVEGGEVTTVEHTDGIELDTGATSVWIQFLNFVAEIHAHIHELTPKTTLVDADEFNFTDSAASYGAKKITWANLIAQAAAYIQTLTNKTINLTSNTLTGTKAQFNTALSDADFATLAGTETLTAKTIDADDNTILNMDVFPGGRLTLTSGLPVTTSDVTGATSIYYTPHFNDHIQLWDGTDWKMINFTEKTLALGTLTSGRPYDVFGYISAGALALESLAWASTSARATDITLQDGRYCKSGDKTRLYLGTFYTTSTTQTEDSVTKRFLWNMYNRVPRSLTIYNGTSHNYNTATVRPFNNDQANSDVEWVAGLVESGLYIQVNGQITRVAPDGNPRISFGLNSTTVETGNLAGLAHTVVGRIRGGGGTVATAALGYNYTCILEHSTAGTAPGATFEAAEISTLVRA